MLSITNHQGNANQNHSETVRYHLVPDKMAVIRKTRGNSRW